VETKLQGKSTPLSFPLPQIAHEVTQDWTQNFPVKY